MLGVVTRGAVESARADRSDSDYLKSLGIVGGEELRSMPLLLRCRRRLSWLTINIGLNIVAGLAATGSVLLLGIPLIWVLPACLIGIGIMYRNAMGVESATLQRVSN